MRRQCPRTRKGKGSDAPTWTSDPLPDYIARELSLLARGADREPEFLHCGAGIIPARAGSSGRRPTRRHCSKTENLIADTEDMLDYQSERHCSKTIGTKSPLQGTDPLTGTCHSMLNKVQVNNPFTLMGICCTVRPSLEKEYWDIRKKDMLEKCPQSLFR